MNMKRRSRASWEGDVQQGGGRISLGSGAFEGDFSLKARMEEAPQTNPEELIAGAHAGCFTMALSNLLTQEGHPPTRLDTTANVYLESRDGGFVIPRIELQTTGSVPGLDEAAFQDLAQQAKANCPVSKVLAGAEIGLQASLAS